jgi:hypothetical protein
MFVDQTSLAKVFGRKTVNGVLRNSSAYKLQSFHIPPFRTPHRQDIVFCENVQAEWINAFLVDNHKIFIFLHV